MLFSIVVCEWQSDIGLMKMRVKNYSLISKNYEISLESTYRKEKGIFYTDMELASHIIKFLDLPKSSIILDPCCGTGNFLTEAKELGYEKIYGADIDKGAISLAKKNIDTNNIRTLDTLGNDAENILNKFNLSEPVDAIIGNPPYAPIAKDIIILFNFIIYFSFHFCINKKRSKKSKGFR